ncbi:MAG: hypothetical protein IJD47_02000 [Clostridia bacterium]|nr:hypothetical protein [Clostridia bacterium]
MITAKFGGTAITPNNLVYLKKILTPNHKMVVVSAIGKIHPNDVKTTDLLATYFRTHNEQIWQTIANRYRKLVDVNCIDVDIDKLLHDAKNRTTQFGLDYCMSLGEELSAKVVAKFLGGAYIEAQEVVVFGRRKLNTRQTLAKLKNATRGVNLAVIGGFYGGFCETRKTFSRGGSDVTASLCALATNSTLCENWTDANGVCQGNPTEILGVKTLTHLSYEQMYTLAKAGATVLHPDAVMPLQTKGIPLVVGNFYNKDAPKTLVSNCTNTSDILCVTQRQIDNIFVATVVHNLTIFQVFQCLSNLTKNYHVFPKNDVFTTNFATFFHQKDAQNDGFLQDINNYQHVANINPTNSTQTTNISPIVSVTYNANTVVIKSTCNVLQQIFDAFNCN